MKQSFYKIIFVLMGFVFLMSCEGSENKNSATTEDTNQTPVGPSDNPPVDNPADPSTTPPDSLPPDTHTPDATPPSDDPSATVNETGDPNLDDPSPTPTLSFKTSSNCVGAGEAVLVSWDVKNAEFVYFEGNKVTAKGTQTIYPQYLQTLKLSGVNGMNVVTKSVDVGVKIRKTQYQLKANGQWSHVMDTLNIAEDGKFLVLSEGSLFSGNSGGDFVLLDPNSYVDSWAAMALDPTNSQIMYAATDGRVYRSTDGGSTWPDVIPVRRNNIDLVINTLYVSPENPHLVFIGVSGGAFVLDTSARSLDLMTDLNKKEVTLFAAGANIVFAVTDSGLMFSTNNGGDWSTFYTPAEIETISVIVFDQNKIWVGTSQGLYRTDLQADVWEHFDIVEGGVNDIAVFKDYVVIAASGGVYSNQGNVWKQYVKDEINWVMGGATLENTLFMTSEHSYQLNKSETSENHCPITRPRTSDLVKMQKWDLTSITKRNFDLMTPLNAYITPRIKLIDH